MDTWIFSNLLDVLKQSKKLDIQILNELTEFLVKSNYISPSEHVLKILPKNFDYIVFEGCDFSGKTYLIKKLVEQQLFKEHYDKIYIVSTPHSHDLSTFTLGVNTGYICNDARVIISQCIRDNPDFSPLVKYILFLIDDLLLIHGINYIHDTCFITGLKDLTKYTKHKILVLQDRSYISALCYQQLYLKGLYTLKDLINHRIYLYNKYGCYLPDVIVHVNVKLDEVKRRISNTFNKSIDTMDKKFMESIETIHSNYQKLIGENSWTDCELFKYSKIVNFDNNGLKDQINFKELSNLMLRNLR
jgi:thymidylate kinase